ncbi:MAG: stage II sporulation protein M [Polyangiaceae bacterium]
MALISAVTESAFAAHRQRDWDELSALVTKVKTSGLGSLRPDEVARAPSLYRDVCADLARAEACHYSLPLQDWLGSLTSAAHTLVYAPAARSGRARFETRWLTRTAFEAFPRAVRRHRGAMLLAFALFFVPLVGAFVAATIDPNLAFKIVPEAQLRPLTEAYAKGFAEGRGEGEGVMMAGFYVNNNVGIALRCFALGIFGGLGSAFFLVFNGVAIGATLGYVVRAGAGNGIVTFIVGHGTFELGAIVIAGGAGLAMGWSIVAPGERTRLASLQTVAKDLVVIVVGAACMLLVAAFLEGFWSGSSLPDVVKWVFGGTFFLLVLAYLAVVGRGPDVGAPRDGGRPR